jgi:carbamoyl-phosphate synthase large subunit
MLTRVLITNAGRGASNNLIRSLRAGDLSLSILGCHDDQFVLKNSEAERNFLIPPPGHPRRLRVLQRILETESVDLLIPTSDRDVRELSRARSRLGDYLFLPRPATIAACQDKCSLSAFLRARSIPAPLTYPVTSLTRIEAIFRGLGHPSRVWCRVRTGAGALGAIPVASAAQAASWIAYWRDMRGVPVASFTLSEYLPGRDFGCQSLWKNGQLVLIKTYERLSYLGAGSQPAEVSSVAALAKTVFEPRVVETCAEAIRALDRRATGIFSTDLKGNAVGVPCITEINPGRFSSATNIFDLTGKRNMAVMYVRLARGEPPEIAGEYDITEDHYMLRDIDALPRMFHAEEFFDPLVDART